MAFSHIFTTFDKKATQRKKMTNANIDFMNKQTKCNMLMVGKQ